MKKTAFLLTLIFSVPSLFGMLTPSWEEINALSLEIIQEIPQDDVDVLMGISVGGLVPTVFFSNHMKNKNIMTIAASSYTDDHTQKKLNVWNLPAQEALEGKNILLVDDIADSGQTIHKIREILLEKYAVKSVRIATLYVNSQNCQYFPDYYGKYTDQWILFPWEEA